LNDRNKWVITQRNGPNNKKYISKKSGRRVFRLKKDNYDAERINVGTDYSL